MSCKSYLLTLLTGRRVADQAVVNRGQPYLHVMGDVDRERASARVALVRACD